MCLRRKFVLMLIVIASLPYSSNQKSLPDDNAIITINDPSTSRCNKENNFCGEQTGRVGEGGGLGGGGLKGGGKDKGGHGLGLLWLLIVLTKVSTLKIIAALALIIVVIIKKFIMAAAILLPVFIAKIKKATEHKSTYVYVNKDEYEHEHGENWSRNEWYKKNEVPYYPTPHYPPPHYSPQYH